MDFTYAIKRYPTSKSIKITVKPDLSVLVTAPPMIKKGEIDVFVKKSSTWVMERIERMKKQKQAYGVISFSEKQVLYLGQNMMIAFNTLDSRVAVKGTQMIVSPVTGLVEDVPKTLVNWLEKRGREILVDLVDYWAKIMNVRYTKLRFGQQESRWGSCSTRGTLSFNWRLIHFDVAVIEYVVIHELAHLEYPHHQAEFWSFVNAYCPDYATHRAFLKKHIVAPLRF